MRWTLWRFSSLVLLAGSAWGIGIPQAQGQSIGTSRSLGGYGASPSSPMASMGSSSLMIPYAGSFGGFMPYRMAAGVSSPLSFAPRGSSVLRSTRTSFRLSPMSSGMGMDSGLGSGLFAPLRSQGAMRLGGGLMNQPMAGDSKTSVMPPNFGYPFYQPPSLFSPVSTTSGMSM
jgi:hypothetical protein